MKLIIDARVLRTVIHGAADKDVRYFLNRTINLTPHEDAQGRGILAASTTGHLAMLAISRIADWPAGEAGPYLLTLDKDAEKYAKKFTTAHVDTEAGTLVFANNHEEPFGLCSPVFKCTTDGVFPDLCKALHDASRPASDKAGVVPVMDPDYLETIVSAFRTWLKGRHGKHGLTIRRTSRGFMVTAPGDIDVTGFIMEMMLKEVSQANVLADRLMAV